MTTLLTMYDSAAPEMIPSDALAVAGYIDEGNAWQSQYWSRFPNARKQRISLLANPLADAFDFENGSANMSQVRNAVEARAAVYLSSIMYMDISNVGTVHSFVSGSPVAYWVAWWWGNGIPTNLTPLYNKMEEMGLDAIKPVGWQYEQIVNQYDRSLIDIETWPNFNGEG
jgi:hypothetical protein